jgi:hypothetical protein
MEINIDQLLSYITIFLIGIAVGCHLEEGWWYKLHEDIFSKKSAYSTKKDIDKMYEEIEDFKF